MTGYLQPISTGDSSEKYLSLFAELKVAGISAWITCFPPVFPLITAYDDIL